jgi:hypothetical protein
MVTRGPEAVFQAAKQPISSASPRSAGDALVEGRYEWQDVPGEELDGPGPSALSESAIPRLACCTIDLDRGAAWRSSGNRTAHVRDSRTRG